MRSVRLGVERMEERLNPTPTISTLSSNKFYVDEAPTPQLSSAYVGYQLQGDGGNYSDVYAQIGGFSAGIGLAANASNTVRLGDLTGTNTENAYFYLTTSTTAATPLSYAVTFYSGLPSQGNVVATYNESITSVVDTIKAAANKFTGGTVNGPTTLAIGSTFDVIIQGSTGTIGNPVIAYTPATLPAWLASAFQLQDTSLSFTSGDLNGVTVADALFYQPPASATSNSDYTATFTFRAINATSTSTSLSPLAYIGSGTQVKHTDTGTWASLPVIAPVVNNLTVSMTAGAVTGGESTITLTVNNSGSGAASLDQLRATLAAGLTYVAGSSTLGGSAYANPTSVGGGAVWSDAFSVSAGGNLVLTFRVNVPQTGNYQIAGFARIGDTQIDTTIPTNDDAPAIVTVGADTTPPAPPAITGIAQDSGASPTDRITNAASPSANGTAEAGSTVKVYNGATLLGTATADASGHWLLPLTLPEGFYSLAAFAIDAAGNASAGSAALAVTVDRTAPDTAITAGPASPAASATFAFAGFDPVGSGVASFESSLDGGAWVASTANPTLTGLSDGNHTLAVRAIDLAGNADATPATYAWAVDTNAPSTPAITAFSSDTGAAGDRITSATVLTLTGTAEAGSAVVLSLAGAQVGTATADAAGNWSVAGVGPLADGPHAFTATAADAAGNTSAASTALTVTVDTASPVLPPVITGISPDSGFSTIDRVTNAAPVAVNGTAEAGSTVSVYDGANLLGAATADAAGNWSLPLALPEGVYGLAATATDAAGNTSGTSAAAPTVIDRTAPVAASITSSNPPVGVTSPVIGGTAEPGSTVAVYDGATLLGTATADATGAWSFAPSTPLAEGTHTITSRATDPAGNVSPVSAPRELTIMIAFPLRIDTATEPAAVLGRAYNFAVGVTGGTPGFTFRVSAGALPPGLVLNAATGVISGTPTTLGSYSFSVSVVDRRGISDTRSYGLTVNGVTVSGVVFLDYNADGTNAGSDAGLAGRRVYLDENGNGAFDAGEPTAFTDGTGAYRIDVVREGFHTLRVELFPSEVQVGAAGGTTIVAAGGTAIASDLGLRKVNPAFPVATTADLFAPHGGDTQTALVRGLYLGILGREGSVAEWGVWTDHLRNGLSLAGVTNDFLRSDEYLNYQVDGCYRMFLGREADAAGRAGWLAHLLGGMTYEEMAQHFLDSPEYLALYPDSVSFVRSLYRNELGREGGAEEVQGYVTRLENGESRGTIARGFIDSTEAYLRAIDSLYAQFLNRPGEADGRANWLAFSRGGGRLTDLAEQFVLLPEFGRRIGESVG